MKSIIQTPTPDLQASLDFYKRLGFTILSEKDPVLVSDGKVVVQINPDRYARAGIKLYSGSWQKTTAELRKLTSVIEISDGYLLSDPSGTWIYLLEGESPSEDFPESGSAIIGNYAGLSMEVIDMQKSVDLWKVLGFSVMAGGADQGWVSLAKDDGTGISLMKPLACPHLFFNPSLTYFNGKENPQIISKVREAGVPITEEITHFNKEGLVDNIIIRDPGGLGFFLFND